MFSTRDSERRSSARAALLILLATAGLSAVAREPGAKKPLVVVVRSIPDLCPVHRATGRRCLGCGMTRAFVLLWRGRMREAIDLNPASPFIFAALVWLVLRASALSRFDFLTCKDAPRHADGGGLRGGHGPGDDHEGFSRRLLTAKDHARCHHRPR
jgi:hypothetical protein